MAAAGLKTLDMTMLVLSAACVTLLMCASLSKYIDPNKAVFFAFPGLLFPIFYVAGTFLALYWLVRWKVYAAAMALVLILCVGDAGLFYKVDLRRHYSDDKPGKGELVVMSYNVMGLSQSYGGEEDVQRLVAELVRGNNVDILCMQEFPGTAARVRSLNSALPELRYRHVVPYFSDNDDLALAIYSRYPILETGIVGEGQVRTIYADVRIHRDTLRVVNNHLQSTTISGNDVDFMKRKLRVEDTGGEERMRGILRKLADNYRKRAPQARRIESFAKGSPYQTVICGDFNDTPVSYTTYRISRHMQDAFVKKGRGATGTYNGFFNMFRIDYILASKGLEINNYYAFDEVYSDHNPVAASIEFAKK